MLESNLYLNSQETVLNGKLTINKDEFVSQEKIDEAMAVVNSLDFKLQTKKMVEYNGLDKDYVLKCFVQYKNFLGMKIAYKGIKINFVPNSMIDEAWHQHILDTEKYSEDCQMLFGEFLHHYPYSGLRGKKDVENWKEVSQMTSKVYEHHFKNKIYDKDGGVGRGCSSQGCWC